MYLDSSDCLVTVQNQGNIHTQIGNDVTTREVFQLVVPPEGNGISRKTGG